MSENCEFKRWGAYFSKHTDLSIGVVYEKGKEPKVISNEMGVREVIEFSAVLVLQNEIEVLKTEIQILKFQNSIKFQPKTGCGCQRY